MQIRLSSYTSIEAEEVRDVRVHGESGTVSVRMLDGVIHYCPNDRGKGAWDTAIRLANDITRAKVRMGKPVCKASLIPA
jgi:hypothetical protein